MKVTALILILSTTVYVATRLRQTAPLTITANCPGGQVGVFYSCQLVGSGGTPPYTWSIGSGSLPEGLTLDPVTGVISGTPTAPFPPVNLQIMTTRK